MRNWSAKQIAVFEEVASGTGHTAIQARAGSGKTTTIVEALNYVPQGLSVLFVAFNKSIATELSTRAPKHVDVMTLHALGFRAVRAAFGKVAVDGDKMKNIVRKIAGSSKVKIEWDVQMNAVKVASLAKGYLVDSASDLEDIIDRHQIMPPDHAEEFPRFIKLVQKALAASKADTKTVDFDDMVWFPIVHDLSMKTYDRVFIDETQDLNAAQVELALRSCEAPTGRICAVGDDRQAIYGFRGAASDAFGALVTRLNAKVLPLSVTYRCAKAIVRVAQTMVPDLEAAPDAIEGIVRECSISQMIAQAQPGDFILSAVNAPLIGLCVGFLKEGRKANIQGRDVGAKLASMVKRSKAKTTDELVQWVENWCEEECARLAKKDKDQDATVDTATCLISLTESVKTVDEVLARIETLFADTDSKNLIILSSTHKAKGLERDRVFVLRDTYMKRPTQEAQNLFYVAVTRARNELVFVKGEVV
jgi:DNA helicase-2/ATP-dependent DNA helicase PcrA